jgi:hypothetical protein
MFQSKANTVKGIIDRIEDDKAVILLKGEDESIILDKIFLPSFAKEGDIVTVKVKVAKDRTKKAKEEVSELIKNLKKT